MSQKHKILFLYTELAEYFLACCRELTARHTEVHIVRWPVNKEAPFKFSDYPGICFYERNQMQLSDMVKLVERIQPGAIVCSGWIDKDYVTVCRKFSGQIPTVMALDNKWTGSLKQRVASLAGRFIVSRYFSHAWVPGERQASYARKLGFKEEKILRGFYSCDQPHFSAIRTRTASSRFAHRFIFAGRYYEFKGVKELWQAFAEIKSATVNDWELWCMGTGDVEPFRHPAIKHFGFVQPSEMENIISGGGVFILPSRFEPWGVVLHEFASVGFPLLCSSEVGAAGAFLRDGENGYIFKPNDKESIKSVMKKIINMPDEELVKMGEKSAALSEKITPSTWANTILKILNPKP